MNKIINFVGKSDKGIRPQNEDNFVVFVNNHNFLIAAVADGMGGHLGGRMASALTIKHLKDYFENIDFKGADDKRIQDLLIQSVKFVSKNLIKAASEDPELLDMGTTLNYGIIIDDYLYTLNIGDSRTNQINERGRFIKISEEHNLANLAKKDKKFEQYANYSNYLTSSLGPKKETHIDLYKTKLDSHGYIIISSDGFHNFATEKEVEQVMSMDKDLKGKIYTLIELAANNNSNDNITCVVVEYGN